MLHTYKLVLTFLLGAFIFHFQENVRIRIARMLVFLIGLVIISMLSGCAVLPMPFQPVHSEYNSNAAEITWLAIDAVDTAQTMHIKRGSSCAYEADPVARFIYGGRDPAPARVLVTNIALASVHVMVTSWLDDKFAVEDMRRDKDDDYGIGPWMAARFVWHAVSIGASSGSVVNNYNHGCKL